MNTYTPTDYRVFISYSSKDQKRVLEIWNLIRSRLNYKCWIDLEGIQGGDDYRRRIINAIDRSEYVLFMLSDNSIASPNTEKEINYATEMGKHIVPVVLDGGKLRGWYLFEFGNKDYIDATKPERVDKLIRNLSQWLNCPVPQPTSQSSNHRYQEDEKRKNLTFQKTVHQPSSQNSNHSPSGYDNGHEYVDLGLPSGLLWATCNLGASAPSESGHFYAWGELSPKKEYLYENVKYFLKESKGGGSQYSKYVLDSRHGRIDGKKILDRSDDAATKNNGGKWRMPTINDWRELKKECVWELDKLGQYKGYRVKSKRNGNSLFLPFAGSKWLDSDTFDKNGTGLYWSSSIFEEDSDYAHCCFITKDCIYEDSYEEREKGFTIRPVTSR